MDVFRLKSSASSSSFQKNVQPQNKESSRSLFASLLVHHSRQRLPISVSKLGRPRLAPKPVVKSVAFAVELVSCSSSSAAVAWVGEMRLNRTSFSYKYSAAATRDCPTDRRGVEHRRKETETRDHSQHAAVVKECYRIHRRRARITTDHKPM